MTYTKCQAQDPLVLLAPIIRDAVVYGGKKLIEKAFEEKPADAENAKEIEKYKVGKYEVQLYEGVHKEKSCVFLDAYENGKDYKAGWLAYAKENPADMEKIEAFRKMTEPERIVYLKETFERFNVFLDFGPEEPVKVEAPAAAKETASATPITSPAETVAAPTN